MFPAALSIIAKTWKQSKCSLTEEMDKDVIHIYTRTLLSSKKKNEIEEFPLWQSGLRIQLQQLGLLWRYRFDSLPSAMGQWVKSSVAASAAQIQSLAWELSYTTGAAIRNKGRKEENPICSNMDGPRDYHTK